MNIRRRLEVAACGLLILACGLIPPAAAVADASGVAVTPSVADTAAVATAPAVADTAAVENHLLSRLAGLQNACQPYPWLVTGGQPSPEALEALANAGIQDVFDLRGAGEPRGFDEAAVARSMKLQYMPIPVTPADFDDSKFTAFRHHLIVHGPEKPMFIHCASGNRVGAALLPWLVLDQGLSADAALEIARTVGLRSPDLTKRAMEYIRAHGPARP